MSLLVNNLTKIRQISGRDLNSSLPAGVKYVAVPAKSIPTVVRWSFLLFTATLPFEVGDFTLMGGTLSPAKISGYVLFLSYFLYHVPLFAQRSLPRPPHAMWWFLGYVGVYALNGFFLSEGLVGEFSRMLFRLLQLLVFFWIAADLLKDRSMTRMVLLTYMVASVLLAMGIVLNLPGFSTEVQAGRLIALGDNPNATGILMGLSAVMVIGLSINAGPSGLMLGRFLLPLLALPLLLVMVNTGARAALAAFLIACAVYLLPFWRSKGALYAVILMLFGVGAVVYTVTKDPDSFERWQRTYYEGHLAGREQIFPTAVEMIVERPIFGWQPVEFWHELGFRGGFGWRPSDAHNLYLHVLLEVGLIGAIPFFVGLTLCARAAWRARSGYLGLLPLALVVILLANNMSGTGLMLKSLWLVLALALSAESTAVGAGGRQSYVLLVGRPSKDRT